VRTTAPLFPEIAHLSMKIDLSLILPAEQLRLIRSDLRCNSALELSAPFRYFDRTPESLTSMLDGVMGSSCCVRPSPPRRMPR
jgi:hypothetical protein